MNIPKKINVGAFSYKVLVVKDLAEGGEDCCGTCSMIEQVIRLREGMPDQIMKATIIHEALEAINYHYKLNLEHDNIERLDAALLDLLEANKGLIG